MFVIAWQEECRLSIFRELTAGYRASINFPAYEGWYGPWDSGHENPKPYDGVARYQVTGSLLQTIGLIKKIPPSMWWWKLCGPMENYFQPDAVICFAAFSFWRLRRSQRVSNCCETRWENLTNLCSSSSVKSPSYLSEACISPQLFP